ncbi:MAG: 50S ribosomal protein L11 methyltransferase [Polyangiaceae bacterium]
MALVKLVVRTPRKHAEVVSAVLFEAGAGGIEELESSRKLVVYAASREDAEGIAERARERLREVLPGASGIALSVEVDEHSDWDSAWTQHLRQMALTPSIVIQPLSDETPVPEGARRILFDPKLSFGDGAHATTRLASVVLERACRDVPGLRVLDFGSGTGVLAFVALLSGASEAFGVDIDPVSVAAAQRNAMLNGLEARATFALPSELGEPRWELVVANLEAPTLLAVAGELVRVSGGAQRLILTGFLADRASETSAAFAPAFRVHQSAQEEDWAVLELVPVLAPS